MSLVFGSFSFVEEGGGVKIARKKTGIGKLIAAVFKFDRINQEGGLMSLEETRGELITERHHASGAAGVENIDGIRLPFLGGRLSGEKKGGGLIIFGVPGF